MNELIKYLLDNIILDFQGDLTLETVRECLKDDSSPEAKSLLNKLNADQGVNDMMITLADCLQEHIRTGINEETLRNQVRIYSDS